jgi:dethiobiotin synthetase
MTVLPSGLFVTGTDTGVGKTLVACALLKALRREGVIAVGMKPVAAGARRTGGRLVNQDVEALRRASSIDAPAALVNPYCFEPAIAPHIAAALDGCEIELDRLTGAYAALALRAGCVVVEGAGGFRVPLGADFDFSDFARALGLPVVLVVALRLGCLNHALLTASAVEHAGLRLAGWVANEVEEGMEELDANVATLITRLRPPLIARIPHASKPDAETLSSRIDLNALVERWRV